MKKKYSLIIISIIHIVHWFRTATEVSIVQPHLRHF